MHLKFGYFVLYTLIYRLIDHLLDLHSRCNKISVSSRVLFIRCMRPFHDSIFIDTCYQWEHGTLL